MKPIFRTAMFGFMKEDVAQFISRQNQEYEKKLKEKDAEIDNIKKSFENEKTTLAADSVALAALRQKLTSWQEKKEELFAVKTEFCGAREEFGASLKQGEDALDEIKKELSLLREQSVKMVALRAKADKFDALAGALSGILGKTDASDEKSGENQEEKVFFTASPGTVEQSLEQQRISCEKIAACVDRILALLDGIDFSEEA